MTPTSRSSALAALLACAACTGDEPAGTPPAIAQLAVTPAQVTAGQAVPITGSFTFTDEDGDITQLGAALIAPSSARQEAPLLDVTGQTMAPAGALTFQLVVAPPSAGSYQLEVWLLDDAGHTSNRLTAGLDAQ